MPRERYAADDAREWLNRAESSLAQAKARGPKIYLEDLCFCAQQAAEKALKALLLHKAGEFPYTHDIAELLRLLQEGGERIPDELLKIKGLTDYAVESRYPSSFEPVKDLEYREAVELASRCVEWVRAKMPESPNGVAG